MSDGADFIQRARDLAPMLDAAGDEIERRRELPEHVVAALIDGGFFRMLQPKFLGGAELRPVLFTQVTEALAQTNASVGWCIGQNNGCSTTAAYLDREVACEIFGPPTGILAWGPPGSPYQAQPVDGGYRISGKWRFASGCHHARWLGCHVTIAGTGKVRTLLFPKSSVEMHDIWHTIGLRGTGSKTIILNDVFIPEYRTVSVLDILNGDSPGREVNTHPMYGGSTDANFTGAMSVPAIGSAKGLIEMFHQRLGSKIEIPDSTNSPYMPEGMSITMGRLSQAAATIDAGRALMLVNAQSFAERPAKEVTLADTMRMKRDTAWCAQQARRAVNVLYEESGGSALSERSPLQQFWRDTNAAAAHRGLMFDWQAEGWVKAVLGLPVPLPF